MPKLGLQAQGFDPPISLMLSHLSVQLTHALMCFGVWSLMGYVKDNDVKVVSVLPEVDGDEEELEEDWDMIE
jgi:hypothetical protein